MDEKQRMEFDLSVGFIYKNMGDQVVRPLRIGVEYFREAERRLVATNTEKEALLKEVATLKAELAHYKAGNASTDTLKKPEGCDGSGRAKCRKMEKCENWEPEPQTPAEGTGVRGAALIRDEDKHPTDRLPVVGEKKSFFGRLFGG